jgi:nitroreductase
VELIDGIRTRRSIRAYKSTPIPKDVLVKVLEAARWSPSYTNTQPWEVVVVSGKQKDELYRILTNLAEAGVSPNREWPRPGSWPPELERRVNEFFAGRLKALGVQGDEAQRKALRQVSANFNGAPCVVFLFMDRALTTWSAFDVGLFAQTLILAAHACGLGSCLQAAIINYPDAIRDFLGIAKTKLLVLGILLGYPDVEAPINAYRTHRASLDEFVTWRV